MAQLEEVEVAEVVLAGEAAGSLPRYRAMFFRRL